MYCPTGQKTLEKMQGEQDLQTNTPRITHARERDNVEEDPGEIQKLHHAHPYMTYLPSSEIPNALESDTKAIEESVEEVIHFMYTAIIGAVHNCQHSIWPY
jgi:hypothetical protein